MRLDKFLCDMGLGTRSQVKEGIKKGLVQVDGSLCKRPETQVTEQQTITWQGRSVSYVTLEYYMLHKPAGVLSATEDKRQQTVLDLIDTRKRKDLFPVGRLDKGTEGLLIITNDGPLAHSLLSPKRHVDKVYFAKVEGDLRPEYAEQFAKGLDIGDEKLTMPAKLEILKQGTPGTSNAPGEESEILLTIREGRFHQVKRMLEAVDCKVTYLKRLSMGPLKLDESLAPGEYRPLTEKEVQMLKEWN